VLPATASARAVEAASSNLVVEYFTYGRFDIARSRSDKYSTADEAAAIALGGVVLGPSGNGYATFGTGVGTEAVLVIARGSGGSARTVLHEAGVLLWSPPDQVEDGLAGWLVAVIIAVASFVFALSPRRRNSHL